MESGLKIWDAAASAIGLSAGTHPTADQFDAIADHLADQQGKGGN